MGAGGGREREMIRHKYVYTHTHLIKNNRLKDVVCFHYKTSIVKNVPLDSSSITKR